MAFPDPAAPRAKVRLPHRMTQAPRTSADAARRQATERDVRRPRPPAARARPPRSPTWRARQRCASRSASARSWRSARCSPAASIVSSLADADIVWGWIALSLALNLASVAGKAIVWKAALDALPGPAPGALRARRAGALHRLPAQHGAVRAHRRARPRRGARRAAGAWPATAIPASTIAGTVLAEQLVLGVALALAVVALAPVLHLPHMVWQLVIVFLAVLAVPRRRADARAAQGARPPRAPRRGPLAGTGAVLASRAPRRRRGRGRDLLGCADRRHLGRARGLPHPRRARRRRPRLRRRRRSCSCSPSGRATSASSSSASPARSSASTPSRRRTPSRSASASSSSRACSGVGLGLVFLAREGLSLSGARALVSARDDEAARPA